jgi:type II secretory pathway pseudopilin PulG
VVSRVSRDTERQRSGAGGFTLLEVVLAIGLCGAVMALLATAIDMYLVRVDTSRTQVETAELARALLTKMAEDLRAVRYSAASTSVPTGGFGGDTGGSGSSGSSSTSGGIGSTVASDLGIYGTLMEIRIDRAAERSYRQMTVPSTELTEAVDPSDMPQTVEYYFEEGRTMKAGDLAAGGVADSMSLAGYTGLYRRQTPTAAMAAASTLTGGSSAAESGEPAELLAPEVVQVSFMYSDGTTWFEEWDSTIQQSLPAAVEMKVSLFSDVLGSEPAARQADEDARRRDPTRWVEYRLLVRVPQLDEPQELTGPAASSSQQQQLGQGGENGT